MRGLWLARDNQGWEDGGRRMGKMMESEIGINACGSAACYCYGRAKEMEHLADKHIWKCPVCGTSIECREVEEILQGR